MLVFKESSIEQGRAEGQWFERVLWEEPIRFKIRPRTENIVQAIRDKFKNMKEGQKKEQAIRDELIEYIFEDFEGLGEKAPDGTIRAMEPTLENKKKVLAMQVPINEPSNLTWVLDRANELGFERFEEEQKNL